MYCALYFCAKQRVFNKNFVIYTPLKNFMYNWGNNFIMHYENINYNDFMEDIEQMFEIFQEEEEKDLTNLDDNEEFVKTRLPIDLLNQMDQAYI